jgi:hypothetical protein
VTTGAALRALTDKSPTIRCDASGLTSVLEAGVKGVSPKSGAKALVPGLIRIKALSTDSTIQRHATRAAQPIDGRVISSCAARLHSWPYGC